MANVTVTVRVEDDLTAAAVDGVLVRVYDSLGTTFITEGSTLDSAPGEVEFTLLGDGPGITYVIRMSRNGYSFPAGATKNLLVTDPPSPSNFFTFLSHTGPTSLVATIAVKDDQGVPVAVDGVLVQVFNAADAFVGEGVTGAGADDPGEFTIPLLGSTTPGVDYTVRLLKNGFQFLNGPLQQIFMFNPLVPPATNIFDFTAIDITAPPQTTNPEMCRLSGKLVDVSLRPIKGLELLFKPLISYPETDRRFRAQSYGCPTVVQNLLLLKPVKVVSDSNGCIEVDLPRGGLYEVHVQGYEHPFDITEFIKVPDAAGYSIIEVLLPYVASVTFGTDPINLTVGASVEVGITALLSSGVNAADLVDILSVLVFTTSPVGIAEVTVINNSTISVLGVGVGAATIGVERIEALVAPRRPAAAALVVTPPVVNVT